MANLNLLRASAGSGKTFAIAASYLNLLFQPNTSTNKFSKILAVTFTNKATEEMKSRIIENLVFLAKGKFRENDPIAAPLLELYEQDKEIITKKAQKILSIILHNYAYFNIKTIDSFAQSILRNFYFELKMHPAYEVELDHSDAKKYLIDTLIKNGESNGLIKDWIFELIDHKLADEKSWSFYEELGQLVNELFSERFHELEPDIKKLSIEDLKKTVQYIRSEKEKISKSIKSICHQIINYLEQEKLSPNNFYYGGKGTMNVVFELYNNRIDIDARNNSFKKRKNFENWLTKDIPSFFKKDNSPADEHHVHSKIHPLLVQLQAELNKYKEPYYTLSILQKNIYIFGLFIELSDYISIYREENNIMFSNDVNKLLRSLVLDNDISFIYEKAGEQYSNFMIDEFQDTSTYQWEIYKPLVANSLANDNSNLIVGDIKQAIYRWREGNFNLLLYKVKADISATNYKEIIIEESLLSNFRSEAHIISFNNYIFHFLPSFIQANYNEDLDNHESENSYLDTAKNELSSDLFSALLPEIYKDVKQLIPAHVSNNMEGVATITLIDQKRTNGHQEICELMNEAIADLVIKNNVSPGEIAILARSKRELQATITSLLNYWEKNELKPAIQVVSENSLLLKDSPIIKIIQAVFKYIQSSEELYLREIAYNLRIVKEINPINTLTNNEIDSILGPAFNSKIAYWKQLSLYEILQYIIIHFELDAFPKYNSFLAAINEKLYNFSQKKSNDVTNYLVWWEENMDNLYVLLPESNNAIQALTIHKSKGLAFEHVFLPFSDMELNKTRNVGSLWVKPRNFDFPYPIQYSEKLLESEFVLDYYKEKMYKTIDTVNGFYVACTRAKKGLYIYGTYKNKSGKSIPKNDKTISQCLYNLFKLSPKNQESDAKYFTNNFNTTVKEYDLEINDIDHKILAVKIGDRNSQEQIIKKSESDILELKLNSNDNWTKLITIRKKSHNLFNEEVENEKRLEGTILHQLLSNIVNPEDLEMAIQKMSNNAWIKENQINYYKNIISQILTTPEIKPFFNGEKVITEREIISRDHTVKIPDRVVKLKDGQYWVIDYKFANKTHQKSHERQIKEYQNLLEEIVNKKVKAGLIYYYDSKVELVVL